MLSADAYVYVLQEGLAPSLAVEFDLAIALLTCDAAKHRELGEAASKGADYRLHSLLWNGWNCVYFACQVLKRAEDLVVCLGINILKLLVENSM